MRFPTMKFPKLSRKWLLAPLVAGAMALGIGIGALLTVSASTAMADHRDGDGQSFASRVAEKLTGILGLDTAITEEQVKSAFNAANGDRQVEMLQARLDQLEVEEETATAIMDWFQDYPYADLIALRPIGFVKSENIDGVLDHMVSKERITQEESDGIKAWYDDRPELPEGLEREKRGRHGKRGHHRGGAGDDGNGDGTETRFNERFGGEGRDRGFFGSRFRG